MDAPEKTQICGGGFLQRGNLAQFNQAWLLREVVGPLATVGVVLVVELLSRVVFSIPNPPAIILLIVVFAAFNGGLRPGLISATIAWLYFAYYFSIPGQPFHYTDENLRRVLIWAVTTPVMALLVAVLQRRVQRQAAERERLLVQADQERLRGAELAATLQAQNEELQSQQEELQAQHEELQAQAEEIQSQDRVLRAQHEELRAANKALIESQRALAESQERLLVQFRQLTTVFDSINAVVYVADMQTYELLFINEYGAEIFGADSVGKPCFLKLQSGQTAQCPFCTNDRLARDGIAQPAYVWEFQNTVTGRWFLCIDKAIPWIDGRLVRLEVAADISARKQAEEERERLLVQVDEERRRVAELAATLQAQNEELQSQQEALQTQNDALQTQAEQLRQLARDREEYANAIAHDLRNPLGVIQGHAQVLQLAAATPHLEEQVERSATAIIAASRMMNTLIQDLVDAARLESRQLRLNLRPLDLPSFIVGLKERLAGIADADRVVLELPAVSRPVLADPDRIERILMNLLGNAFKYSAPDSKVTVSLTERAWESGWEAVIAVSDCGKGIPPEDLPHLFERYYRGKDDREGLGLGLYIVRGLVEAHGGTIWVESEGGKGSTFYFSLPPAVPSLN